MGKGVVAAGHPLTAEAGARTLRAGGNAVDAALGAMFASFVAEPLLTGLGGGGYMIVSGDGPTQVLDFFVDSPGHAESAHAAQLQVIDVSFGDAKQLFHIGPASCGVYGVPAGICLAAKRWGTMPLSELAAPAAELAREGVPINGHQAYVAELLHQLLCSTPDCERLWAPEGRMLSRGDRLCNPQLADSLERLGKDGAAPFYTGDIAAAVGDLVTHLGGALSRERLASYKAVLRHPVSIPYKDRVIHTNPPPSAGGTLLAYALGLLDGREGNATVGQASAAALPTPDRRRKQSETGPPSLRAIVAAMRAAEGQRTQQFIDGLDADGFGDRFLGSRLGSTTHISVIDADGLACGVTATNGEGSGVLVPGAGIHLNNVMGEEDLNPFGFHRQPAGKRMPSMMAPTVLTNDGDVELVIGSAGSTRIRSALLQTIIGVVDKGLAIGAAIEAPRLHCEGGTVFYEPGLDVRQLGEAGLKMVAFRDLNLFFGGVQGVQRMPDKLVGAGDPRRGGVAISA